MISEYLVGSRSSSKLLRFVDHNETYGQHIILNYIARLSNIQNALDIGAGSGRDLLNVRAYFPQSKLHAIEYLESNCKNLEQQQINAHLCDIETDTLPFTDDSLDLVICNQVLEHAKELFWILHEISRTLKVGGHLIVGVPNIASFHNRIGLLLGKHPTQAKACSAHIRIFSKSDFMLFLQEGFSSGYSLESFDGSQFYPFPKTLARPLSKFFPTMSFSIFFLLKKTKKYNESFLEYPAKAGLETNFNV